MLICDDDVPGRDNDGRSYRLSLDLVSDTDRYVDRKLSFKFPSNGRYNHEPNSYERIVNPDISGDRSFDYRERLTPKSIGELK